MYFFILLFSFLSINSATTKIPEKIVDPIVFERLDTSKLSDNEYLYEAMIKSLSEAHEYIYDTNTDKLNQFIKDNRKFTKSNFVTLSVFHLCRFHLHDKLNEPLKAYNQGVAILNSPLFNYMNPSDIEYLLFRLNTISKDNKYYIPNKYSFPLKEWFVLSSFELLQISRAFTRQKLKTLDIKQANQLAKYTKETPYNFLLKSYIQINKKTPITVSRHARSKQSSRWKRRNRKKKSNEHTKTISLAKRAIQYSFSKFQKSFVSHHLLFLYRLTKNDKATFQTLTMMEKSHPNTDVYGLLADYYRKKKDWKLMHHYNDKLQVLDPKQDRIAGPEPVISPLL